MKCLTPQQTADWWAQRCKALESDMARARGGAAPADVVTLPTVPAGKLCYFARAIAQWLLAGEPLSTVGWIRAHGIWDENLHLYYVWRRSHGDLGLLDEAPGHLFLEYERPDLTSFLYLALAFGWDASCADGAGARAVHFDHDGHYVFLAGASGEAARGAAMLRQ